MEKEQQTQQQRPFRVIVVGGGLVAITAAHVLSKADIDFVILEQHDNLAPWIGSLLVMWPATYRIFNQLGIQEFLRPIFDEMDDYWTIDANDGSFVHSMKAVGNMWSRNHGYGIGLTSRPQFVESLHSCLPESAKARIHVKKRMTEIEVLSDGVRVHCEDGTFEEGSIVIGADGVHSRTRQCMEALATGKQGGTGNTSQDVESPYLTTYRALVGNLPKMPDLKPSFNYQGIGYGVSPQVVTGKERGWWYVYEALEKPTRRRRRYTEQDKQEMMEKYADLHVAPGYRLRDVYAANVGDIGLINVEEGRVNRWTWGGRIVLVGDAVRKLDPHGGLGYNSGVADVVELVNGLRRLVQITGVSKEEEDLTAAPTVDSLRSVFEKYEKTRKKDERAVHEVSRLIARSSAWLYWWHQCMATWLMPWAPVGRWMLDYVVAPVVSRVPVLEWLDETDLPQGVRAWVHHPLREKRNSTSTLSWS
ncbi:putative monooxygenase [Xylariaceae sp. FL1651]|nr:putative monooxygenase [Xylariaceae sp. FL1651]